MMRQILYLTANDRLGVLKSEDKLRLWQDKLQIIRWWYADEAVEILNDGGMVGYNRGLAEGEYNSYADGFDSGYYKGFQDGKEGNEFNSFID